jgi:hypothetical protein
MEKSWLIQRLEKPRQVLGMDNPFSFGGGFKNGGLSDDAMDLIRDIWSFDYMGAAEFEFGAVPKALNKLAQNADDLVAFEFEISLADVEADFRDKSAVIEGTAKTLYALARAGDRDEVESRIRGWASEQYNRNLKETTRLASTLRPHQEWDGGVVGWLELDNGFMFFTDQDMFTKTADLFGVER